MNTLEAVGTVIMVLGQIADGIRPNPADRATVRVLEAHGQIRKDYATHMFKLTAKGAQLVSSARTQGIMS